MQTPRYSIIYADPPWAFRNVNTGGSMKSGAMAHYPTMTIDQICELNVQEIASPDSVLFMWWVASMPAEALQIVEAWGYTIKTMTGFNWVKRTKKDLPFFGMGFWTRQGSENMLIATRGKPKRASAAVRAVVTHPAGKHSEKPAIFREKITELMGEQNRIELFARKQAKGWDCWGNELSNTPGVHRAISQPRAPVVTQGGFFQ